MIVIFAMLFGVALGALTAKRRKGSGWDVAQYAAVYGIIFGLGGLIATLIIHRNMV